MAATLIAGSGNTAPYSEKGVFAVIARLRRELHAECSRHS